MRRYYEIFPPWMFFTLIMICLFVGSTLVVYYYKQMEVPKSTPIGKYYDREMSEKIDQDASVGILPMYSFQILVKS